jgi:hypothetical protein
MSLRKSPQLTPALLAAARQNAQHSTGPRSAAARLLAFATLPRLARTTKWGKSSAFCS